MSVLVGDEGFDALIPDEVSDEFLIQNLLGFESK